MQSVKERKWLIEHGGCLSFCSVKSISCDYGSWWLYSTSTHFKENYNFFFEAKGKKKIRFNRIQAQFENACGF